MADPVWTNQYNTALGPEQNGTFTQNLASYSVASSINSITSGSPANRRLEITGGNVNAGAVWLTSQVPTLDPTIGTTIESLVQVSGDDQCNFGYELTFLDRAIGLQVHQNRITVQVLDGQGLHIFNTADNSGQTRVRLTYAVGIASIYRNAVLLGTIPVPSSPFQSQRVLYWQEGLGSVTIRELKYFVGGAVAP
jgi:hypothetical protein